MDYQHTLVCFTSATDSWKAQQNTVQEMHLCFFLLLYDNRVQSFTPVVKLGALYIPQEVKVSRADVSEIHREFWEFWQYTEGILLANKSQNDYIIFKKAKPKEKQLERCICLTALALFYVCSWAKQKISLYINFKNIYTYSLLLPCSGCNCMRQKKTFLKYS